MNIQSIAIERLKPAPYNPRITLQPGSDAWNRLERSLEEFQLLQPIVWNQRTGHVVSGHQRLTILKHQQVEQVECVVVDLPDEKEKALNVTLNNARVGSDWDAEKLVDLIEELQELPDFDATLTGFDEQQLQDLVLTPAWDPASDVEAASEAGESRITLEVPTDCWENVCDDLDQLLGQYPSVKVHVTQ